MIQTLNEIVMNEMIANMLACWAKKRSTEFLVTTLVIFSLLLNEFTMEQLVKMKNTIMIFLRH